MQDNWRVSDRLTLNLGLRYDLFGYNQPTTLNNNAGLAAQGLRTNVIPIDHKDFGPRFGSGLQTVQQREDRGAGRATAFSTHARPG